MNSSPDGKIMIPEVTLRDWHPWFAWYPVRLKGTYGRLVWLRPVERRTYWFLDYFAEYRPHPPRPEKSP